MDYQETFYGINEPKCHPPYTDVMKIGNVTIIAGRWIEISAWPALLRLEFFDSYGNRASSTSLTPLVTANTEAQTLLPEPLWSVPAVPTLRIQWDDYEAPALPDEWWLRLVQWIEAQPEGQVAIGCLGGHGRTGTALAILASLANLVPKNVDPVLWVRQRYCDMAIESREQMDYIEDVTGRTVTAKVPQWRSINQTAVFDPKIAK